MAYLGTYIGYYHNRLGAQKSKDAQARFIGELNRMMGQGADAEAGHILTLAATGIKYQTPDSATLKTRLAVLCDRFIE